MVKSEGLIRNIISTIKNYFNPDVDTLIVRLDGMMPELKDSIDEMLTAIGSYDTYSCFMEYLSVSGYALDLIRRIEIKVIDDEVDAVLLDRFKGIAKSTLTRIGRHFPTRMKGEVSQYDIAEIVKIIKMFNKLVNTYDVNKININTLNVTD